MSTLASRIKEAMGEMSPADLARATKSTPAAVTQWLDGSTKSLKAEKAVLLEIATGYRASWITTGKGPKQVAEPSGNLFEDLTEDEKQLLDNYRAMLDDDQREIAEDVANRAAKMRAYMAKALEKVGGNARPAKSAADAKRTAVARAALDVTEQLRQRSLIDERGEDAS